MAAADFLNAPVPTRRGLMALGLGMTLTCMGASAWAAPPSLRVLTHSSFDLPKPLLAQFEKTAQVKLQLIKAGDAGEVLNKLILTKAKPIADVVYGIDNSLAAKAIEAGVLDAPVAGVAMAGESPVSLPAPLVPIDRGYVTLNIDKAWFAKQGVALPQSLQDLTQAAYKNLVVVQHPATSSPGLAFLAATIAEMGEDAAFAWWAAMRHNGLKVTKGWTQAYYTDFSRNGGKRPIVVSYATSPAAEVFYSKTPLTESPTASLHLRGGVFQQIEGAALVKGGAQPQAASQFIAFLRSPEVQQALPTQMWMWPVVKDTPVPEVMRHATEPNLSQHPQPSPELMAQRSAAWISRWTEVVLR